MLSMIVNPCQVPVWVDAGVADGDTIRILQAVSGG
jgi:sulfur carrier protein ThiS